MSDLIPLLLSQLQADIKKELSGRPISVVFDGTTRLGEAMAVVIHYIDSSFTIKQRLIRLQLLAKSMSGEEIAREIIASISTQYGIASNQVVAMMHDRAACNGVALRTLKVIYPQLVDVGCFSHTLDLVGEKSFPFRISLLLLYGGLVSSLRVPGQNCSGRRELAEHLKATQPRAGGASMR